VYVKMAEARNGPQPRAALGQDRKETASKIANSILVIPEIFIAIAMTSLQAPRSETRSLPLSVLIGDGTALGTVPGRYRSRY
jgi:hypothetical protein